jgi:hypothetical protein
MKSLKSNLLLKKDISTIKGGLAAIPETNNESSESGDDECSSSLDNKDTSDCYDVFTGTASDIEQTTAEFDDICNYR